MSSWMRRSGAALAATTVATLIAPVAGATATPITPVKAPIFKSPEMTYQVKPGDTVSAIALRSGTTIDAVVKANKLRSAHLIYPGQLLRIPSAVSAPAPTAPTPAAAAPAPAATPAPSAAPEVYVVKPGDTLGRIARAYKTTVAKLAADNAIANPNRISVGQRLTVGTAPAPTAPAANTAPAAAPAKPAPAKPSPQAPAKAQPAALATGTTYVVRPGDTLGKIALMHGTSVAKIVADNAIANPNRISVGQKLSIGTPAPSAPATHKAAPKEQLVKNNFPGYTYADETVAAANENKHALINSQLPSRAEVQATIKQVARELGVDPKLALAHAFVESGFNASAVSPANAIGTMQVIPSSGTWASQMVGRQLNLLNPYDNIVAGVAIIRSLQRSADSLEQGIAGYYQGLGGVRKYGMRPDTVNYVAKVKAAMGRF
ncbi:LysM peptidoglycan-binding domain-containing protein [Trueperella pecoris]|uniref:LysM peptidoglycan-binding domain-containing protein n=1 Tax=Trueperella pecoris TaxID=2733571 RepID=A0A7M1R2N4_9ACTO|nr:lytic transglycosylase domain-containing protein [Trueperella pecoris]QOR48519.1 LysM peptidoglycan-binding domain-containing protein [Trueperella pecoris]